MSDRILNMYDQTKKKRFVEKIGYLGIEKLPNILLVQTGKERVVSFSGSLAREEISQICQLLSVEGIGLYFGKYTEDGVRLSVDALHLLQKSIDKNRIEVNESQEKEWFLGKNVELTAEQQEKYKDVRGFVAVVGGEDIIGTGKKSGDGKMISNFLPRERRVKS